jgi:hypothetical protein
MVKRFVLFTYDSYYPGGGWNDKSGDFYSVEEAHMFMRDVTNDVQSRVYLGEYYDVVDLWSGGVVASGETPTRYRSAYTIADPLINAEGRDERIAALSRALEAEGKPWYSTAVEGAKKGYFCVVGSITRRA